jgi:hypothetical protein
MNYENGNVIELDSNEKYFIYNQKEYNGRRFALLVDIENNDKVEMVEIITDENGEAVKEINDDALKVELLELFNNDIPE